jgi:hypothetical protein
MKRRRHRNGDEIALPGGCDGCNPSRINGVLCHEAGCPEAWRDHAVACRECGCDFYPEERFRRVCEDCARAADDEIGVEDDDDEEG